MIIDSRVPATINALVALWTATGANVFDGPPLTEDYSDAVFVGYDGDPDGDFEMGDDDSDWAGLGALRRNETFDIVCSVVTLVGENDIQLVRENAYALYKLVSDALRADPSLGQTPPFTAELKGGPIFTEPSGDGWQCRKVFRVHVVTRI